MTDDCGQSRLLLCLGCGALPDFLSGRSQQVDRFPLVRRPDRRQATINTAAIIPASSKLAAPEPDDVEEITARRPRGMEAVQPPPSPSNNKKNNRSD